MKIRPLFLLASAWLLSLPTALAAAPAAPAAPVANLLPAPPAINGTSWILVDFQSGQVLAENNADLHVPPASLTKLMTAYLVEQRVVSGNISEDVLVPISVNAWRTGGSRMFVQEGTQVKLSDLMQGLVIQSGNDAATALAEYVGGSTDAFANMMNAMAAQLGMKNTHYMNPTGLPDPDHYGTARDLATLAAHIIRDYPDHYALYKEKHFTWNNITQPNRLLLLWRDPRVDGLKTGHTEEAGYCQVTSAVDASGMRLIAVVMGTKSEEARAVETSKLLNYGFRFFQNYTAYEAGKTLVSPRLWLGKQNQIALGIREDLTVTVPNGSTDKLAASLTVNPSLRAPVKKGDVLGEVSIALDGKVLRSEPLVALEDVPEANIIARLWDHILMFFSSLFG